jgi:hypothetical protein
MATPKQTSEFTLQIKRTFAAPREKVLPAWAQREQIEQWMCKDVYSHTVIHHQQDIRTGGRYRIADGLLRQTIRSGSAELVFARSLIWRVSTVAPNH